MVKEIYIVRHGQTDYNLKKIVQGSGIDAPLNNNGKLQANAFYKAYKDEGFDKIYVSNLKRTYESVEGFIRDGLPFEKLRGLDEISWGAREGVPFNEETNRYYYGVLEQWQKGETHLPVEGGESPEEVALRQKEAMNYILSKEEENKILVCMHGRAMRILLAHLFNYSLSNMDIFEHQNLGLYKLRVLNRQFQLLHYNDASHLEELILS